MQLGGIHRILRGQVGERENFDLPGALLQLVRSDGLLIQSVLKLRMRLRRRRCNLFLLLLSSRPRVQRRQIDDLDSAWQPAVLLQERMRSVVVTARHLLLGREDFKLVLFRGSPHLRGVTAIPDLDDLPGLVHALPDDHA